MMGRWKEMLGTFLDETCEVHSFIIGVYSGLTEWKGMDSQTMQNPDVKKEPHYAYCGYVVGTLIRLAIVAIAGIKFFGGVL